VFRQFLGKILDRGFLDLLAVLRFYPFEGGEFDIDDIAASMLAAIPERKFCPGAEQAVVGDSRGPPSGRPIGVQRLTIPIGVLEEVIELVAKQAHMSFKLRLLWAHETHSISSKEVVPHPVGRSGWLGRAMNASQKALICAC